MDNECDVTVNNAPQSKSMMTTTDVIDEASPDEPIKISIYTSDDGQYHMKYDNDCTVRDDAKMPKSKRKTNLNKLSTTTKPTTETLYEIDLYCDVCNHDYKSLMSLNRHMKTRKHLNQLAKLNEANEQTVIERDWSNYDNYFSAYDVMPRNMYNSIVQTLLDDDAVDAMVTEATQHNDTGNCFPNTFDSYVNSSKNYVTTKNDIHEAMNAAANDATYDENQTIVDTIQRAICNSYKCLVCGDLFTSAQLLQEHTQQMRENCATKIDGDDEFDLDAELQNLEIPSASNMSC